MRKLVVYIGVLVILGIFDMEIHAQTWSASISAGDRAATVYPFAQVLNNTFYPTLQVAAEYYYSNVHQQAVFQTALIHWHYHRLLGVGIGLRSELGYRHHWNTNIFIEALCGLGYLGTLPSEVQFFRDANGNSQTTRPLISSMEIPISLGVGYEWAESMSVFVRYQYSLQFPYNTTIFLIPTDNLFLGWRIFLGGRTTQ